MTTPAPEPVEVPAAELAAAEARLRDVFSRMSWYDLGLLLNEYDRRGEMCDVFEARWNEARADLSRALPVVEAAGRVVSEYGDLPFPEGGDGSYPRLGEDTAVLENAVRDLARAVRMREGTG